MALLQVAQTTVTRAHIVKCSVVRLSSFNSKIPSMVAAHPSDTLYVRVKPRCREGGAPSGLPCQAFMHGLTVCLHTAIWGPPQ